MDTSGKELGARKIGGWVAKGRLERTYACLPSLPPFVTALANGQDSDLACTKRESGAAPKENSPVLQ